MAETYKLVLSHSTPWAGCDGEDEFELSLFGYSDEEWDELDQKEKSLLLDGRAEENFWNAGYEYHAEVINCD